MNYYNLNENKEAVPCSLEEWGALYDLDSGIDKRRVAWNEIEGYEISTVFLGLDHGYGFTKNPLIFETMIFGKGRGDGYQTRCSTWNEAKIMHKTALEWVKNGCPEDE